MKRAMSVLTVLAFLVVLSLSAYAQEGALEGQKNEPAEKMFGLGEKIMGYDIAPQFTPDSDKEISVLGANPSETGLGIYRGVVIGQFIQGVTGQQIACDFGSSGVWVCFGAWNQISGVNPDWIIGVTLGDTGDDELIGDFGTLGLWMWHYSGYPGTWTQLSGVNADWAFGVDDDNDGKQEIYVDFGTIGLWRWDYDGNIWRQASGVNPHVGLRMDTITYKWEEACILFPSYGVWRIFTTGSGFYYTQLTGTVNYEDDHASAKFTGGAAEDLIMDFGSLGLWLLKENDHSWNLIINDSFDRVKTVKFGTDNAGLVLKSNTRVGLFYWHYVSGFPGIEVKINTSSPEWYGFCEPFSYNYGDGDDELAVDMGASGLWVYEYYGGTWAQISGKNPVFMVAGDYYGDGDNTALLVDFGSDGLWLYDGLFRVWGQLSGLSPDNY